MTETEMRDSVATRNGILTLANQCGLHPLRGSEDAILTWFKSKGVSCDFSSGFLRMHQGDGSEVIPSAGMMTLRSEKPELFAANPRYDKVSSLEDFNRGTSAEISKAKSDYIREHGLEAFQRLPKTRAAATLQAVEVGPQMTRKEYLSLSFSEKARLCGAIGSDAISVIMNRCG